MKGFLVLNLGFILTASFASANVQVIEALSTRVTTAVEVANVSRVNVSAIASLGAAAITAGANQNVVSNLETVVSQIESVARSNNAEVNGLSKEKRMQSLVNAYVATVKSNGNADFMKILNGDFMRTLTVPGNGVTVAAFDKLDTFFRLVSEGKSLDEAASAMSPGTVAELASKCSGDAASALR